MVRSVYLRLLAVCFSLEISAQFIKRHCLAQKKMGRDIGAAHVRDKLRTCSHGGEGPQAGDVPHLPVVKKASLHNGRSVSALSLNCSLPQVFAIDINIC